MADQRPNGIPAEHAHAVLAQLLRRELDRIIRDQDQVSDRSDIEIDADIEALDGRSAAIRRNARQNDFP